MLYNPQLETFICVVDCGSFSKAAEKLYITSPAVIKQINSLENNLKLQLFERSHRGLRVTEAGKSLYRDAKYLIVYSRDSLERAQTAMDELENTIHIGVSPVTPPQTFMDLWPEIKKHCPRFKMKLVPFENTPENAREILGNLGQKIDVVAGIFDDTMLKVRKCNGLCISRESFGCAVSLEHPLAEKEKLTVQDLYGQNLLIMRRGWSRQIDLLRETLWRDHPKIHLRDFGFYDTEIFNQCENSNDILLAIKQWEGVHPLMKFLPVEWEYKIPFGLLYSLEPSKKVKKLLTAIEQVRKQDF